MCGIVGVIGAKDAPSLALSICLQQENRGSDATGVSYLTKDGHIKELKKAISPSEYSKKYLKELQKLSSITTAVTHNRAATCNLAEKDLDKECHPFMSEDKTFTLMQNGTVGYAGIMEPFLSMTGHKFHSGIDSEVLMHMLEDIIKHSKDRDEAFSKFISVCVGNIIVMFNDGEMWGIAYNDNFNVVIGKDCIFMASLLNSILSVVKQYPNNEAYSLTSPLKGGVQIRVFQKDNTITLKKYGEWNEGALIDGSWVSAGITMCDFCKKTARRCEKFKIGTETHDRCHDCFKAGITTLPEPQYHQSFNMNNESSMMHRPTSRVDPNVDDSQHLTCICSRCHLPHTNMQTVICNSCGKVLCNLCFADHNCDEHSTDPSDGDTIIDFLYNITEKKIEELVK